MNKIIQILLNRFGVYRLVYSGIQKISSSFKKSESTKLLGLETLPFLFSFEKVNSSSMYLVKQLNKKTS